MPCDPRRPPLLPHHPITHRKAGIVRKDTPHPRHQGSMHDQPRSWGVVTGDQRPWHHHQIQQRRTGVKIPVIIDASSERLYSFFCDNAHWDWLCSKTNRTQGVGAFQGQNFSSAPLADAIKDLKGKYLELQDAHKRELKQLEEKLEQIRTENHLQSLTVEAAERERDDLRLDIRNLKDTQIQEKDKIYNDILNQRKKCEIAASDLARLENTHQKAVSDRQKAFSESNMAHDDIKRYRDQIEELLGVNAALRARAEDLENGNHDFQSKIDDLENSRISKELEEKRNRINDLQAEKVKLLCDAEQSATRAKQEEYLRLKIANDCEEFTKSNLLLKAEVDDVQRRLRKEFEQREFKINRKQEKIREAEQIREDLRKIEDEIMIQKIALDSKEKLLVNLTNQAKSLENSFVNAQETRTRMEERLQELDSRARAQENDIIQLGQDKSILTDDASDLKTHGETKGIKLGEILRQNRQLHAHLDKFMKEMSARRDFANMITEVESSGENYLNLVRSMRGHLGKRQERNEIDDLLGESLAMRTKSKPAPPIEGTDLSEQQEEATPDLYAFFNVSRTSTTTEIKKAYHKLCLLYHPDKLSALETDTEKAAATEKFQTLARYYAVLTNPDKRARYDETGCIDDSGLGERFEGLRPDGGWEKFFRELWGGLVTTETIEKFAVKYKDSEEEKQDLIEAYKTTKGDMDKILERVPLSTWEDEPRFRSIILNHIESKSSPVLSVHKKFFKEDEKATQRRKKAAEAEMREFAGQKNSKVDSLEELRSKIVQKKNDRLDGLIERLEREEEARASKGKRGGKKGKVVEEPSEEEFLKLREKLFSKKVGENEKENEDGVAGVDAGVKKGRKAAAVTEGTRSSKRLKTTGKGK
ncbi:hypothetical protein HDU67_006558 [Dinochytrium kinnereticum]|nr:hypothetical protein HDU67_006558 [Dinochytrium kinnereticum]